MARRRHSRPGRDKPSTGKHLEPRAVILGFLLLAGAVLLALGLQPLPAGDAQLIRSAGDLRQGFLYSGATLSGAGLALFCVPLLFRAGERPLAAWLWPLAHAIAALGLGALILICGMRQFGGFDHSALIETAWRMQQGQIPYVDFPCTVPVGFLLGANYAFALFGVSWRALVLFQATFTMFVFVWSSLLLRRLVDEPLALLINVAAQAASTVLVAYWWYNPMTTALAVIFFLSASWFFREPGSRPAAISYVLSLALCAAAKPNTSGLLIILVSLILVSSRAHRVRALLYSACALALFLLWLRVHGIFLPQVLSGYLDISGRGLSLQQLFQDLSDEERFFSIALVLALALPLLRLRLPGDRRETLLLLGGALAGLYGFVSNGENKLVDLPLLLLAGALAVRRGPPHVALSWQRYMAFLAIVLTACGLARAATRQRVQSIGYGAFFEYQLASEPLADPFFRGLRTGPLFARVVEQVAAEVQAARPGSIYFGPRMQWGYAAFDLASPRDQPIWWHPGVSFAPRDEALYLSRFAAARFDTLIFKRDDATYFSNEFRRLLGESYDVDSSHPDLTVLHRKK